MLTKKLKNYFATHPEATVVFVALGVLFPEHANAQKFLGGVHNQTVQTVTREQVEEKNTDAGGSADQQPNGNTSTEGTESHDSLSDNQNNDADQQPGTDENAGDDEGTNDDAGDNEDAGTDDGSGDTKVDVSNPQETLNEYVGKPVAEIEAAIEAQTKIVADKEKELHAARGFGKNKPKKELEIEQNKLSAMQLALKETKLPDQQ